MAKSQYSSASSPSPDPNIIPISGLKLFVFSLINSIVPNNIDHLFADDEERQNVREQWRYNY